MPGRRVIGVVDSHTAGEPTRVLTSGVPWLQGDTLAARQADLFRQWPDVVTMTAGEPRGSAPVHVTVPLPPSSPAADIAVLFLSALGPLAMCGHALIGTVTTLVETGALPVPGGSTVLRVETLAGIIAATVDVAAGSVQSVTFRGAPSWVLADGVDLVVPDLGAVRVAVAHGGLWYAVVDAAALGLTVSLTRVPALVALGARIRRELARHWSFDVPPPPQLLYTDGLRTLVTSSALGFDRSPCGTGTCARLALLHARGEVGLGEDVVFQSVVGSTFTGRVESLTSVDGHPAVVPVVTSRAHLTAFSNLVFAADDPLAAGFLVPAAVD